MSGYAPTNAGAALPALLILAITLGLGSVFRVLPPTLASRLGAWAVALATVSGIERATAQQPAGFRMIAIIATLFLAMKNVVVVETSASAGRRMALAGWLAFSAWPGMRPELFARQSPAASSATQEFILQGTRNLILGATLLAISRGLWIATASRVAATVVLLPALSMVVHFGLFLFLAGACRFLGFPVKPLFQKPLRATSLTEFWGRRWNLAFSQMIRSSVYSPLRRFGSRAAKMGSFVASGLLHELAISLPVRAGYGLPMAYFLLQGGLVLLERQPRVRRVLESSRSIGRAWTLTGVALPLPLLFHRPFLRHVVWPVIGIS